MIDDDDPPALCADTLAALQSFLKDKQAAEEAAAKDPFAENWALSQFWYDEQTSRTVAQEVEAACQQHESSQRSQGATNGSASTSGRSPRVACLACPSLFRQLQAEFPHIQAQLFEFDTRFDVLGNFTFYDYNHPENVPLDLRGAFTVVVADPPYLSEECLSKTMATMRLLACSDAPCYHYLLSGAVMRHVAYQGLGLRPVVLRPQHRNKLGNEFLMYCSRDPLTQALGGWDPLVDPAQEQQAQDQ